MSDIVNKNMRKLLYILISPIAWIVYKIKYQKKDEEELRKLILKQTGLDIRKDGIIK